MLPFLLLVTGGIILQLVRITNQYTSLTLECSSPRYTCQKKSKTRTRARIRHEEAVNYSRVPVTQLTRTEGTCTVHSPPFLQKFARASQLFPVTNETCFFFLSLSFSIILVKVETCTCKLQISSAQSILL